MTKAKKYIKIFVLALFLPFLTGCAAGSATAGYALKAREADYLNAQGEERVVTSVKREIMTEFYNGQVCSPCIQ